MQMLPSILVWIACCLLGVSALGGERLPVPDDASQKAALTTIREIFRQDISAAKIASQQVALAKRMLGTLEEKADAAAANYVLLTQAQGLAVKAADLEMTRRVIDELTKRYEVDPLILRTNAIRDIGKGPTDTKLHTSLAHAAQLLADDSVEQERFDAAINAIDLAYSLAVRTKSNELRREITARKAEITELQKLWDGFRKAKETLSQSPHDPTANDIVGRYLITSKSDWDQGLRHLALSSDKDIQPQAKKDDDAINALGLPSRDETVALADGWWEVASKQSSPALKAAMKLRAGQWYGSVLGGLEGLTKVRVDQRLTESRWIDESGLEKRMPRSRTWHNFQPRFKAAQGWFHSKFALCQAAPFEEAVALNEALSRWKFCLVRFRPYHTSQGLKVAAIWHKDQINIESQISHGSEYETRRREEELRAQGYFPRDVAGYLNEDGDEKFVVVWSKAKPEGGTDALLLLAHKTGEKLEQSTAALLPIVAQHFWNSKKEPIDNQIRRKPGDFHTHVWGSRAGLLKTYETIKDVCIDLSLASQANESDINKLHWAATFQPRPETTFVEVYKPNYNANLAEWIKLASAGQMPMAIGAVQLANGSTVSATIWHGSANEPE